MATVAQRILTLVDERPGLTEAELADQLFMDKSGGYQQRVNSTCRRLRDQGQVKRAGDRGPGDPYRYYLTGKITCLADLKARSALPT